MSINSGEMTSESSRGKPVDGFLGFVRGVALMMVAAGTVGSLGLMLRADQRTPRFLLVLFVFWILSPFVGLAWANMVSKRWPALVRATLYGVTHVITLGSLAFYGKFVLPPAGSPRAFVFVAVPPVSWLLMTIVVLIAVLISGRRSHRGAGA